MRLEDMTPVMLGRTKECKTPGERLALMAEEGVELTDEQLEGISGGSKGGTGGDVCKKNPDSVRCTVISDTENSGHLGVRCKGQSPATKDESRTGIIFRCRR